MLGHILLIAGGLGAAWNLLSGWFGGKEKEHPKAQKGHGRSAPPKPTSEHPILPSGREQLQPAHQNRYKDQSQYDDDNEYYLALRAKASEYGNLMVQCFQQSHEAYERRDGAHAKVLSEQGKRLKQTMEKLNAEASAWIYRENNLDVQPGEVDLHDLYVKEAISYSERAIQEARGRGDTEIRLIVGKGLHSDDNVAKIKPALEDFMRRQNLPTRIYPPR